MSIEIDDDDARKMESRENRSIGLGSCLFGYVVIGENCKDERILEGEKYCVSMKQLAAQLQILWPLLERKRERTGMHLTQTLRVMVL